MPLRVAAHFRSDLRLAFRSIRRRPGLSLTAIAILALGTGINAGVFGTINALLFRPFPFPDPDQLVELQETNPQELCADCLAGTSYAAYLAIRDAPELTASAAHTGANLVLSGDGPAREVSGNAVSADFFEVAGVAPQLGRGFLPADDMPGAHPVVVLGHALWRGRYAGDPSVIGRLVTIDDQPHEVVGVMPPGFEFPWTAEVWVPLSPRVALSQQDPTDRSVGVIIRLARDVPREKAEERARGLFAGLRERHAGLSGWDVRLASLRESVLYELGPPPWGLLAISFLILGLASANLAGLLAARAAGRQSETAVRRALGASRSMIVRQLLSEYGVLVLLGSIGGLAVAEVVRRAIESRVAAYLPSWIDSSIDWRVLVFAGLVAGGTLMLFGLGPALVGSRARPIDVLPGAVSQGWSATGRRLRAAALVAQFALAVAVLAVVTMVARDYYRISRFDNLGYQPEGVLTLGVRLPAARFAGHGERVGYANRGLAILAALPGVTDVSLESPLFLGTFEGEDSRVRLEGNPRPVPDAIVPRHGLAVGPGYFDLMGIPLIRGRGILPGDHAAAPGVVVLDEPAAELLWPGQEALGRRLMIDAEGYRDRWLTVVGVVAGTVLSPLSSSRSRRGRIYPAYAQGGASSISFLARAPEVAMSRRRIAEAIQEIDPNLPLGEVLSQVELLERWVFPRKATASIAAGLGLLALVLALIGAVGVTSYDVALGTRTIGIRLALGASAGRIVRHVIARTVLWACLGIAVGLIVGSALTTGLAGSLPGLGKFPAGLGATLALLLGSAAVVACWRPAWRAARVDPAEVLRSE